MTPRLKIPACLLLTVLFHGCATTWVKTPEQRAVQGIASWYGEEFAGRVTASGEIFDPLDLTAAHPALPFGTIAAVTNLSTGASVEVRINDRGPYIGRRIIDLSYAAADKIGLVQPGIGLVELKVIQLGDDRRVRPSAIAASPAAEPADAQPPPVPFPLPTEIRSRSPAKILANESDFEIEVVEERSGVPTRRRVSADGRALESVALNGGGVATVTPSVARTRPETFVLQLGAFQLETNAEALRRRAAAVVSSVFVEQSMGFFRVRVGPFSSRERALQVQEDLRIAELPSLLLTE